MKKIIAGIGILLAIILLLPVPRYQDDGGTVVYDAILYNVEKVHRINPDINSEQEYIEGWVVSILGIEVFNNVG